MVSLSTLPANVSFPVDGQEFISSKKRERDQDSVIDSSMLEQEPKRYKKDENTKSLDLKKIAEVFYVKIKQKIENPNPSDIEKAYIAHKLQDYNKKNILWETIALDIFVKFGTIRDPKKLRTFYNRYTSDVNLGRVGQPKWAKYLLGNSLPLREESSVRVSREPPLKMKRKKVSTDAPQKTETAVDSDAIMAVAKPVPQAAVEGPKFVATKLDGQPKIGSRVILPAFWQVRSHLLSGQAPIFLQNPLVIAG